MTALPLSAASSPGGYGASASGGVAPRKTLPPGDFDDDFEDDPFALPSRQGGFGAGVSRGGFPLRRGLGEDAPPPKTKADELREDIENAKRKAEEIRAAITKRQGELDETREKRKSMALVEKRMREVLSQQFPERFKVGVDVNLGCFSDEKISVEKEELTVREDIERFSRESEEAERTRMEKESALEKYEREEEEKKKQSAEPLEKKKGDATADASQENFFVDIKRYWESVESKEKTEILAARNRIAERLGQESVANAIREWFFETLGSRLQSAQKKDIESSKNVRETALLMAIAAHRTGRLDELLSL